MRVKNNVGTKSAVKTLSIDEIPSHLYSNKDVVFDLSFPCALSSCRVNGFDNFLKDELDFISKFKEIQQIFDDLSGHTLQELINSGEFRHCHKVPSQKKKIAEAAILKLIKIYTQDEDIADNMYKQIVGGEELYQVGSTEPTRLVGIHSGNVFKVLLADYFHNLHKDSNYNTRTKTTHKYSI